QAKIFDAVKKRLDPEDLPVPIGKGNDHITLKLRRLGDAPRDTPAVVFIHGGNSSGDTFLIPNGGIAAYLKRAGFDVWLLDYRGSPLVLHDYLKTDPFHGAVFEECRYFTYDRIAEDDVRAGLEK